MALSFNVYFTEPVPDLSYRRVVGVVLDDSYPSGGWPIAPSDIGIQSILDLRTPAIINGHAFMWDRDNSKLKVYVVGSEDSVMVENAVADALDGVEIICEAIGA